MEKMKAVTRDQYGGPEVLQIKEVQKPEPKANELLIRIYAAPITAAGKFMREGVPYIGRLAIGLFRPKSVVPGVCFSGVVESVGSEVTMFQVGETVFGETLFYQGTQAEYVCVPEHDVIAKKPEQISHAEAAPICDGHLTSMNFLTQVTRLKAGQRILIIGAAGSLGTAAVQIAREIGGVITGVCSGKNLDLVRSLGATDVIDYTTTDYTQADTTYDVVYDTVGKSTFNKCKGILSDDGVYLCPVLGFKLVWQSIWTSMSRGKKAKFSATGMVAKPDLKKMIHQIRKLMASEKLVTVIDRKYSLDQVREAHAYVDTGRKRGNVVLNIGAPIVNP